MQLIVSRGLNCFLYSNIYLQKQHYPLVKSLVINCTPQNWSCRGTKLKNCRVMVFCPVVSHDVVSHMCELSLKSVPEQFLLQQLFVVTARHCHAAYVLTDPFDCMGSEKTGCVACCHVVSPMCELALCVNWP